ncbi:MAG: hypothetical protein SGBAC_010925 [Bacillariaceae sp.]
MASRKRSIREVSSSLVSTEGESVDDDSSKTDENAHDDFNVKKQCISKHESAPASPKVVREAGLRILLQAERLMNPQSHIADGTEIAAASLSLPLVPAQFSPHQAWSEQTAKWCYDVLDHLQLPREIVYLSMNILEKALLASDYATYESDESDDSENNDFQHNQSNQKFGITNKKEYEKMAITSLYLAVRLSIRQTITQNTNSAASAAAEAPPRRKLQISELLAISGSTWSVQEIQQCSSVILQSLRLWKEKAGDETNWNFQLHQALVQATPHSFCKLLFFGLHKKDVNQAAEVEADAEPDAEHAFVPRQTRLAWLEVALYLIELSVCDGGCHRLLPSVVALASLQAACEILQSKDSTIGDSAFRASKQVIEETLRKAYGVSGLPDTTFVCKRLQFIYQQSQEDNSNNHRGSTRRNGRNGRKESQSYRAVACSCPTLVVDDEKEVEAEKQAAALAANASYVKKYEQQQVKNEPAYAARGIPPPEDQESSGFHPIRHIQSNLDLEALGHVQHRPISPCPSFYNAHHQSNHHVEQDGEKKATSSTTLY